MKCILGIYSRDANKVPLDVTEKIKTIFLDGGTTGEYQSSEGYCVAVINAAGKDHSVTQNTNSTSIATSDNLVFASVGRLDNATEICSLLKVPQSERSDISDSDVMHRAYATWGVDCSSRMYGDWVFAAWHPAEKRLVISRSHYGNINLYYHLDQNLFAFASNRQSLLTLNLVPVELDELWLAQYLISWHSYFGDRTPSKPIRCLPPAHHMNVTRNGEDVRRYWHPVDNTELRLSSRAEYVEAFRSIFDEAVRCRLRSDMPVAVSLSGGLDSGSVAVTAARLLAAKNEHLKAFTAVPIFDTQQYMLAERFGDELPFVRATVNYSEHIDLYPVSAAEISPIAGIRKALEYGAAPIHGAANLYWMLDIYHAVKAAGCGVLLTGDAGNGGFSWSGYPSSQSWLFQLAHFRWCMIAHDLNKSTRQLIKSVLPKKVICRRMEKKEWYRQTAIHPDFARRLRLLEQRLNDPGEIPKTSREEQALTIKPGRCVVGANTAEIGAALGIEVRDPTCDARMLDFVFSVPDHIFMDPATGIDRWLVREAMLGRLPDQVRLNRRRGRQNADIVPRLRGFATEMESTLDELARGPAADYVDVEYMRQVWRKNSSQDTLEARIATNQILLRGIMAGLFVHSLYGIPAQ